MRAVAGLTEWKRVIDLRNVSKDAGDANKFDLAEGKIEARQDILMASSEIYIIGITDCVKRKKFEYNLGSHFASN